MNVTWTGEIVDGKFVWESEKSQIDFWNAVACLSGAVEIEIRQIRDRRSSKQNRYLWGVVYKRLAEHFGYLGCDQEDIHEICKVKFNLKKWDTASGEHLEAGGSTKKMDTAEFARYVDEIRDWAARDHGCYIEGPNESFHT